MMENQFGMTDIDFENFGEDTILKSESMIKEEINKDDDILLFTQAEIQSFQNNVGTSNFEVKDNIEDTTVMPENSTFNIPFNDDQLNEFINDNSFTSKISLDVFNTKLKTEGNFSHFVKYKIQDGKHTKIWQCGICSKEFGHQYILMRHLPTHTDERKFQCNVCGKAFRQMSTLSQHRAIHSADRPYICEICQKTFNRVSTLISHRKTHTGHKPHRCHLCNKAFHQKGNLRNHIFTHTNERPYKCDICSKGFNQMSNLMCHKIKAHQRVDKPRYSCRSCGKEFHKRVGLRNHEQYEHGDMNQAGPSNGAPRIRYTNGVLVDPINTAAMQHALATNQIPFALLRPLNGIPVLVRVLAAGEKQMLVPATAEDLKSHGKITITPKRPDEIQMGETKENRSENAEYGGENKKSTGSTVQIKIPVVATVIQRCGKDGIMCMDVESPGPNSGLMQDSYLLSTSNDVSNLDILMKNSSCQHYKSSSVTQEVISMASNAMTVTDNLDGNQRIANAQSVDYFDLSEGFADGSKNFQQNFSINSTSDLQFQNVINLQENQENITPNIADIYPDEIYDIQAVASTAHVFENPATNIIAKNDLTESNVLYGTTNLDQQFL